MICDPQLKLGFSVAQFKSRLLLTCYYWLYCWFLVEPMSQGDMVWTCWNVSTVLPGRRRPLLRPHLTSVTAAALAASPSASHVQDRGAGVSVTYWSGCHVVFRQTLVVAHCDPITMTCGSCSCHEHIINLVIGVSRLPFLDCGPILSPTAAGSVLQLL